MRTISFAVVFGLLSFTNLQGHPLTLAQGLSGNYRLAYIASDLKGLYRQDENKIHQAESFDYKTITTPPVVEPVYLFHDPKGPAGTLLGGGSDTHRLCQGESSIVSQELECAPLSKETWKDEKTQCGIKKLFVETLTYHIATELRYSRTELIVLDKNTPDECNAYKSELAKQLEAGTAPDYFKAMQAAGIITDLKDIPDVFLLTHVYQASLSDEKAVDVPAGNLTGAYSLKYSGNSKTLSWEGEKKERLQESAPFNAESESLNVQRLDNILLFHKPDNGSVRIAGGGQNKIRNCTLAPNSKESETQVFTCTLFKANEEEVGTGCTIEHWIHEKLIIPGKENPRYERVEQRTLLDASSEGCKDYRTKISSELKEGTSEIFFKALFKSGGIASSEQVGDTFQLVHEYTLTPDN